MGIEKRTTAHRTFTDVPSPKNNTTRHHSVNLLRIFQKIISAPLASWDTPRFCHYAVKQIAAEYRFERFVLLLQSEVDGSLRGVIATKKANGRSVITLWHESPHSTAEIKFVRKVLRTRKPLIVTPTHPKANAASILTHEGKHRYLLVPIQMDNRIYGVLGSTDERLYLDDNVYLDQINSLSTLLARVFELFQLRDVAQEERQQLDKIILELDTCRKECQTTKEHIKYLNHQLGIFKRIAITGEFARVISHEVKNPLATIRATLDSLFPTLERRLARRGGKPRRTEEKRMFDKLTIIKEELHRIDNLISRLQGPHILPNSPPEFANVNDIIREALRLSRWFLKQNRISLSLDLANELPTLRLSRDLMKQVFLNLIKNAAEAMPRGGKLSVISKSVGRCVEVHVADTGIGIPKEKMETLFSPFYQSEKGKERGYGLAITYGIIKKYHGRIIVVSEVNKGTLFKIFLPLATP